jgi:hypothetical protein
MMMILFQFLLSFVYAIDVTLLVGTNQTPFKATSDELSHHSFFYSGYFRFSASSGRNQSEREVIIHENLEPVAFEEVLGYLKTGKVNKRAGAKRLRRWKGIFIGWEMTEDEHYDGYPILQVLDVADFLDLKESYFTRVFSLLSFPEFLEVVRSVATPDLLNHYRHLIQRLSNVNLSPWPDGVTIHMSLLEYAYAIDTLDLLESRNIQEYIAEEFIDLFQNPILFEDDDVELITLPPLFQHAMLAADALGGERLKTLFHPSSLWSDLIKHDFVKILEKMRKTLFPTYAPFFERLFRVVDVGALRPLAIECSDTLLRRSQYWCLTNQDWSIRELLILMERFEYFPNQWNVLLNWATPTRRRVHRTALEDRVALKMIPIIKKLDIDGVSFNISNLEINTVVRPFISKIQNATLRLEMSNLLYICIQIDRNNPIIYPANSTVILNPTVWRGVVGISSSHLTSQNNYLHTTQRIIGSWTIEHPKKSTNIMAAGRPRRLF